MPGFLAGGGATGALMRTIDWSQRPIGPPANWPQSLRTAVSICLNSHAPILLWWGPDLVMLYNDAYQRILGNKHPNALGNRGQLVWPEIWHIVGPMLTSVLQTGQATWSEDQRLLVDRNGYLEESYFTFSYSPIHTESGEIGGVYSAITETTSSVIDARRLRLLSELNARLKGQETTALLYERAGQRLHAEPDFPFVQVYAINGTTASRLGASLPGFPDTISLTADDTTPWPVAEVVRTGSPARVDNVARAGLPEAGGFWEQAPDQVLVMPVVAGGQTRPGAVLLIGLSPHLLFDDAYARFCRLVTDQIGSEAGTILALQAERQRNEQVLQQIPTAMAIFRGNDFIIELANPLVCQLWGRTQEQVLGRPLFEALTEAAGQGYEGYLQEVLQTGKPFIGKELPVTLRRAGRLETVYFDFMYAPFVADGKVDRIILVATEVTSQRTAWQQLEESTQQLQNLFEQAPVAIAILRGTGFTVELANPGICAIWNRTREQLMGYPIFDVLTEAAGQGFEELLTGVLETGVAFVGNEVPVPLIRDGQTKLVPVNFIYEPLHEPDGRITGIVVVASDVTEMVEARQKIEESRQQFKQLTDLVPQILWTARPDGYLDYYNQTWYDYTGFVEGFGDQSWLPILHPDDVQLCIDTWYHAVQTGEPYQIEYRFADRRNPGQYRWFMGRAAPVRDATGAITKWFGTCTDIHDQKTETERLERVVAERTESLRNLNADLERSNFDLLQFASVASHDLKEPLRKIQTFSNLLAQSLGEKLNGEEREHFERIVRSAARMQALVDDVLRLSRLSRSDIRYEPVDLNQIIARILDDLDIVIREKGALIEVDELPVLDAISGQMHQLFQNLISNALKFTADRTPRITIETRPATAEQLANFGLPDDDHVVITIRDNGIGFAGQYREKIFGMFQRLHGRSRFEGTGIGLTICRRILENHNGSISAEGQSGQGAAFHLILPRTQRPVSIA